MTENSSLFGSRSRADTLRSASATRGDAAVLQLAANCGNLSLTEASIWRISVEQFEREMRSFILALAITAIVVPVAAQDYSVEFRQTVQRAENQFAIIWRPEMSMAQEDHEQISKLTSEMSSFASKIGVSTAACSSNEVSTEVDSLSRRIRRIIVNYHAVTVHTPAPVRRPRGLWAA
jgi:methyl-accepting chemotaxis protein